MRKVYSFFTDVVTGYDGGNGVIYAVYGAVIDTSWPDVSSVRDCENGGLIVYWKDGRQTTVTGRNIAGVTSFPDGHKFPTKPKDRQLL